MGDQTELGKRSKSGGYSALIKIVVLGVLALVLLIPLVMVSGIAGERRYRRDAAVSEVVNSWGGEQIITAPILAVPVIITRVDDEDRVVRTERRLRITAETLETTVGADTEIRFRGIYRVPLYSARVQMSGSFSIPAESELDIPTGGVIDWEHARVLIAVGGIMGLSERPRLTWNGAEHQFIGSVEQFAGIGSTLETGVEPVAPGAHVAFDASLVLRGGNSLRMIPVAATSTTDVISDWGSPSFTGSMLPSERSLTDEGFTATWTTAALGLGFPSNWLVGELAEARLYEAAFGVDFYQPVDGYQKTNRSVKYGILFIILPFIAFFLFEVFSRERIHPVQYLLVGAAKVVFYLLLLSLSEHVSFLAAYLVGAAATTFIVTIYSISIVRAMGWVMLPVLLAEYAVLYATLSSEDYALLIGALVLFGVLAGAMIATRKVDWYGAIGYSRRNVVRSDT